MTNYNLTNLTTATDLSGVIAFANNSTEGYLVGLMLVAIFFIMLMSLKRWEFTNALLASSWVCTLLGFVLAYGEFVNPLIPLGFLAVAAFTALYIYTAQPN